MRVLMRVVMVVLLLALIGLMALPALAQEDGTLPAEVGTEVDAFLILALPAMVLIQTVIIQALKWLTPNTMVQPETLARWVKAVFAIVYIGAWAIGAQEPLVGGVTFVNELSEPLIRLLGLLGLWIGPSALYDWAADKKIPGLGAKQGDRVLAFARDQTDWKRAA